MTLLDVCRWIQNSSLLVAMRSSPWLFPIVATIHLFGLAIIGGSVLVVDLRLLGLARGVPVSALADHLLRWARWALVLVVPTGSLMFIAHATEMSSNPAFRLKLLLIAAAFLNAGLFHRWPFRAVGDWDTEIAAPLPAKLAGALSLGLWTGVLACGRLLAYF